MNFPKIIDAYYKLIPYPSLKSAQITGEWKNKLLHVLLGGFILLSPFAYLPATIYAIRIQNWWLFGLNTLIIATLFVLTFSKKLKSEVKLKTAIGTFYILGISVLIILGPLSSGFIWLIVFIILAGFFYGYKGILITEIISCVSLFLLSFPVYFQSEITQNMNTYGFDAWLVNIIVFAAVSLFISGLLNEIITYIEDSLKKEQKITDLLKENQKSLAIEKQRAEEADMLKSKFLANMSHEIRTPLNSIMGFTSLMANADLDEETRNNFTKIVNLSGEQLIRIIDDIIDISKIESNQLRIQKQSVNIYNNLTDIIKIAESKIESLGKKLVIQTKIDKKQTNLFLETDEMRFRQIFTNLIDNAIKYSEKGTITVGYHFVNYNDNPALEFFVKDTGRGIPQRSLEKIFDRFAQAENIEFHEGTGLGLSIVKGILDLLGGTIRVESELEKGSTFYFILPYNGKVIPRNAGNNGEAKNTSPDYSGKTIYIAEDDLASFYFLREVFRPTNAIIEHAINGKELLNLIATKQPDLILLDMNMPVMNGFEVIQEIRKNNSELKVIAQTAYAMAEEKQKCLALGCNDYIAKPIKKQALFKLVDQLLLS